MVLAFEEPREAGLPSAFGGQCIGASLKRVQADVGGRFHHQLETAGITQAAHRRRAENQHTGIGNLSL